MLFISNPVKALLELAQWLEKAHLFKKLRRVPAPAIV
jgi:hypothetical protein